MTSSRALVASLLLSSILPGCPDTHGGSDTGAAPDVGPAPDAGGLDGGPGGTDACSCVDDGGPQPDAGVVPASCEAQVAEIDVCAPICDDVDGAFWDGTRCVQTSCNCVGADCHVFADAATCEAAHAHCDAALCLTTGGRWFSRPQYCAHFECGTPPGVACDEVMAVCDCGLYGIFQEGVGCMPGPLCELVAPRTEEEACADTGGTWMTGICGPTVCGRFSDLDCAAPGCVCGTYQVFDPERGCIQSPECDVRAPGEDCRETRLCSGGSVCCSGGAGGAVCEAPLCADPSGVCGPPRP